MGRNPSPELRGLDCGLDSDRTNDGGEPEVLVPVPVPINIPGFHYRILSPPHGRMEWRPTLPGVGVVFSRVGIVMVSDLTQYHQHQHQHNPHHRRYTIALTPYRTPSGMFACMSGWFRSETRLGTGRRGGIAGTVERGIPGISCRGLGPRCLNRRNDQTTNNKTTNEENTRNEVNGTE